MFAGARIPVAAYSETVSVNQQNTRTFYVRLPDNPLVIAVTDQIVSALNKDADLLSTLLTRKLPEWTQGYLRQTSVRASQLLGTGDPSEHRDRLVEGRHRRRRAPGREAESDRAPAHERARHPGERVRAPRDHTPAIGTLTRNSGRRAVEDVISGIRLRV